MGHRIGIQCFAALFLATSPKATRISSIRPRYFLFDLQTTFVQLISRIKASLFQSWHIEHTYEWLLCNDEGFIVECDTLEEYLAINKDLSITLAVSQGEDFLSKNPLIQTSSDAEYFVESRPSTLVKNSNSIDGILLNSSAPIPSYPLNLYPNYMSQAPSPSIHIPGSPSPSPSLTASLPGTNEHNTTKVKPPAVSLSAAEASAATMLLNLTPSCSPKQKQKFVKATLKNSSEAEEARPNLPAPTQPQKNLEFLNENSMDNRNQRSHSFSVESLCLKQPPQSIIDDSELVLTPTSLSVHNLIQGVILKNSNEDIIAKESLQNPKAVIVLEDSHKETLKFIEQDNSPPEVEAKDPMLTESPCLNNIISKLNHVKKSLESVKAGQKHKLDDSEVSSPTFHKKRNENPSPNQPHVRTDSSNSGVSTSSATPFSLIQNPSSTIIPTSSISSPSSLKSTKSSSPLPIDLVFRCINVVNGLGQDINKLGNSNSESIFGLESAPILYPTEDEFNDFASYLPQIQKLGEHYGMCKIVPPKSWKPGFHLSEKFSFPTQIQTLNRLDGIARRTYHYSDALLQFHSQYKPIKGGLPRLDKRIVDLYGLHKAVEIAKEEFSTIKDKWPKIASCLLFSPPNKYGAQLRKIYNKFIFHFENYVKKSPKKCIPEDMVWTHIGDGTSYAKSNITSPKVKKANLCPICYTKVKTPLLKCVVCQRGYHTSCLTPYDNLLDKNTQWFCPNCILEYDSPYRGGNEITLENLISLSKDQKISYCEKEAIPSTGLTIEGEPVTDIQLIEKKFWETVLNIYDTTEVVFADCLDTNTSESGFPTSPSHSLSKHPWNLNNLGTNPPSVLGYLDRPITGFTTPLLTAGQLFTASCWKVDDHFSYSFNFLHLSQPRTWYCIPGNQRSAFEEAFKSILPELLEADPDLMDSMNTLLLPSLLLELGLKVHVLHQYPGEFVVTFPKATYSSFSHGLNVLETVNFAPSSWLPIGRECAEKYQKESKDYLFSNDELLFTIYLQTKDSTEDSEFQMCLLQSINRELFLRHKWKKGHTSPNDRIPLVKTPQEDPFESQCFKCRVSTFYSYVKCANDPKKCSQTQSKSPLVSCVHHEKHLCHCPLTTRQFVLRYSTSVLTEIKAKLQSSQS